jgi:hypothetical protein
VHPGREINDFNVSSSILFPSPVVRSVLGFKGRSATSRTGTDMLKVRNDGNDSLRQVEPCVNSCEEAP